MSITAKQVKELRDRTGAGMMECKTALTKTDGDIDKAIDYMRKNGLAKADKKSGRVAAEGLVLVKTSENQQLAAMIEVNSETDFVARDSNFVEYANQVVDCVLRNQETNRENLLKLPLKEGDSQTVEEAGKALIAKLGENITVRRVELVNVESGVLGTYVHSGRIGVVAHLTGGDEGLAKDIAMHIAASNPQVINPEDYPSDLLEKEREIYVAKSQDSGKPPEIQEKIIQGQIRKFLDQVSLVGQPFIKEPEVTVGKLLGNAKITVERFVRFEVGEGIEKVETDFAQEVMEQVRGNA